MKNQAIRRRNQSGNMILIIFILVAAFAALSYAVSEGMRAGGGSITSEKAGLLASEIMTYATSVDNAVKQLRINGCTEEQISFKNPMTTSSTYTNPNSPVDGSCDVFGPEGGSLNYLAMSKEAKAINATGDDWAFTGVMSYVDLGTAENELSIYGRGITKDVCMKINEKIGIQNDTNDAFEDHAGGGTFIGAYSPPTASKLLGDEAPAFAGKKNFCRKDGEFYYYQQVLIVR